MNQTRADRAAANAAERRNETDTAEPGAEIEVVKADPLKDMLDTWQPEILKQFPLQLKVNPSAWMRMALTGMRNSKQAAALAKCDRPSLYAALLESARFGLTPFTDEAAIVPFKTTATFIPMAQGFIRMFYNTGQVSSVVTDFIRKGEKRGVDWEVSRGPGGRGFFHNPKFFNDDEDDLTPFVAGPPILAYTYLEYKDGSCSQPAIVTRADAENVMRTRSRAWQYAERTGKRDSLWHTDFPAMWLKTSVRRAAKYGPKSAELQELLMFEAREDRTRKDAPPPLAVTPPPADGIDWSVDIAGGKIAAGTVVDDENGEEAQPRSRVSSLAQIHAIFGKYGLGGDQGQSARRAVASALLHRRDEPMVLIPSLSALDEGEAEEVASRLAELTDADAQAGRDVAASLRKTAEVAVAAARRDSAADSAAESAGAS